MNQKTSIEKTLRNVKKTNKRLLDGKENEIQEYTNKAEGKIKILTSEKSQSHAFYPFPRSSLQTQHKHEMQGLQAENSASLAQGCKPAPTGTRVAPGVLPGGGSAPFAPS